MKQTIDNGAGDRGSIPGRVIPKTPKWYLMPPCLTLSIRRAKWSNLRNGVVPSPTFQCSSYWKGNLRVTIDYGRQLYLLLESHRKPMPSNIGTNCWKNAKNIFLSLSLSLYIYIYIYWERENNRMNGESYTENNFARNSISQIFKSITLSILLFLSLSFSFSLSLSLFHLLSICSLSIYRFRSIHKYWLICTDLIWAEILTKG